MKTRTMKQRGKKQAVRDAEATKQRILQAASVEFSNHGYMGARIDRIARNARANKRLLYYYVGNKEALFLAALERAYDGIRSAERELRLEELEPVDGIEQLVRFTWNYFNTNPSFVALLNTENLHRARHLKKSRQIPDMNSTVVAIVGRLLDKGVRAGTIRPGIDPLLLYISIASLCYFYISNIHTLTVVFARNLKTEDSRQGHVEHVVALVRQGIAAAA
ncbi:MAG: TetR family transcriptional regulator [Reyranella sp.]|jgi:AcrR family transcriptional regulator|uniref:TetR/AcrR family transcriptional regulator n=1 Tax=Reyranella sp. TaxID=1929291 RepID=UPI0025F4365A|nr:TetR/AcrR family transcriptional regulator [Reyranella sp.]MBR2818451.1 TetR family transcriptional regulator [Reyranella sp.]